jgi:hypothetical protein
MLSARSVIMKPTALLAVLVPAALLAACATPAHVSPVEVTRFTAPQAALGSGTISVRPGPGEQPDSWDYSAFRSAVSAELAKLGYSVTDGTTQQVALITVRRSAERPATPTRSPVSVGVGGSTGSYGSGVGLGVGINLGGSKPSEEIDTELRVSIVPSGGTDAIWEGRARFSATANSNFAERNAAAGKLASALFAGFPGQSGETIEVE